MKVFNIITCLMVLLVTGCMKTKCVSYKTVKSVGGCSQYGFCGVAYEEGGGGEELKPYAGMRVCTKRVLE